MGIREDLRRYKEIGENNRMDLKRFIQHGDMGEQLPEDDISVPIKIIRLPEFEYKQSQMGGVGQADDGDGQQQQGQGQQQQQGQGQGQQQDQGKPQPGDPAGPPREKQGQGQGEGEEGDEEGEGDEPGEGGEERPDYYEMDPEEFAEELDEELGLDLDPKGKKVKELTEGDYNDRSTTGPRGTMDLERSYKNAAKRELALAEDEDYIEEALKIDGLEPEEVADLLANEKNVQFSDDWFREKAEEIDEDEEGKWDSFEQLDAVMDYEPELELGGGGGSGITLEDDDIIYKYPEIIKEYEKQAVIVNIRDVSGSMGEEKRDLVERAMTPMDWYLQGKYENAEFIYICHNNEAWEEDREDFFGIQSGGSTTISAAYELAQEILEEDYPFDEWNRYVFAAGDGENHGDDTQENVIPLMEEIDANLHGYIETQPGGGHRRANHGDEVEDHFEDYDDVVVTRVNSRDDVIPAIYDILSAEQQ